jgi:hypothetical protein
MNFRVILRRTDELFDEYSDTLSLFLVVTGGLMAAIALGTLKEGGTTAGYSFIYLKHPFLLKLGLVAIVVGFAAQLSENLTKVHKLDIYKIYWPLTGVVIYLLVLVLGS